MKSGRQFGASPNSAGSIAPMITRRNTIVCRRFDN